MTGVVLSTDAQNTALTLANQLVGATGSTISHNITWYVIVGTVALIVTILSSLLFGLINLGRRAM